MNWGNTSDTGKSASSYIAMLSNALSSFKVGGAIGVTVKPKMERELVATVLTIWRSVFRSNMTKKLGFSTL